MRSGRPTAPLLLAKNEREALRAWTRQSKCPQALAMRARVILLCAEGTTNRETAAQLGITVQTVGKWRQRFIEKRLAGLLDESPQATRRKPRGDHADYVPKAPFEETTDSLQEKTPPLWKGTTAAPGRISRASVHRIWMTYSRQPHPTEAFRLLKDSPQVDESD